MASSTQLDEPQEERYLWQRRHEILERTELSVNYHRKREHFFDRWDKLVKGVAVLGGSSAVAELGGSDWVRVAAAVVAVSSTISLVVSLSERSRRHADLAARFLALEGDIVGRGERDFTEVNIDRWDARSREIEEGEPPALSALVSLCHNEIAHANGKPPVANLNWWQRLTANYFDHSGRKRRANAKGSAKQSGA